MRTGRGGAWGGGGWRGVEGVAGSGGGGEGWRGLEGAGNDVPVPPRLCNCNSFDPRCLPLPPSIAMAGGARRGW